MDSPDLPTKPQGLEFVPRPQWNAYAPLHQTYLRPPAARIRLTHSGGKTCHSLERCAYRVLKTQFDHMYHHGLHDIAYNFLVGKDARIYEGRGWHFQVDRFPGHEDLAPDTIDIAFIGKFYRRPPNMAMLVNTQNFIKYGVEAKLISENFTYVDGLRPVREDWEERIVKYREKQAIRKKKWYNTLK